MNISYFSLVRGAILTVAGFSAGQLIRFMTNIALTHLLAPELFGIMLIVNSIRTGIDLISDVGISQNIVQNKDAEEPQFYNTAWSLRLARGLLLWIVCLIAAAPLAHFYQTSTIAYVLPVAGTYFVLGSLSSLSESLLQKRLKLGKLNAFILSVETFSSAAHLALAYISPTVWSLVFGGLSASAARAVGTYFLLPDIRHRFYISRQCAQQIFTFGKWIFVASIVYFISANFDNLYLAKIIPLGLLGIYGLARTISDVLGNLVLRLGNLLIFPIIASASKMPRADLRKQLTAIRLKLTMIVAVGLSLLAATADLLIEILYDQRYHAAGWMLPVLIGGTWCSLICSLNESTLLGFGKPLYGAVGNTLKLIYLLICVPLSFAKYGILGAVIFVGFSDSCRYIPIFIGQYRERFSFGLQDLSATFALFGLMGAWEWLRWTSGFGTSFDALLTLRISE
jgi:O-antigen/teichoic acid export membrane protein